MRKGDRKGKILQRGVQAEGLPEKVTSSTYRYRDVHKRRAYMRRYMRAKRERGIHKASDSSPSP